MYRVIKTLLIICALWFAAPVVASDQETKALLKNISRQMAELQAKSAASERRIQELETKLAEEQAKNRQVVSLPKNETPVAADTSVATPALSVIDTKPLDIKSTPRPPVTLGDVKNTLKIPGSDTSIGIGGYVKLDINESSVGTNTTATGVGDYTMDYPKIPVGARSSGTNNQLAFSARETRLWLKSFTPSHWGDINTYVEVDFYGTAYSYAPNLRHAYGSFGNLLAGQTWTSFLNDSALADTLDNTGPAGVPKIRQAQLRWTQPFSIGGEHFELIGALEAPRSYIATQTPVLYSTPGYNRYPDLISRLNYKTDWGNLSLAAMARDIRYAGTPQPARTVNQLGGALSLAGKIDVLSLDNIRFMLNYGNVLGAYIFDTPFEDAILNARGGLQLVNVYSGMLAYQHWWADKWRSNLVYGFEQADRPLSLTSNLFTQQVQSLHFNLLWNPLPQATLGMEYIYGSRTLVDGGNGNISRAQLSAKYSF